MSLLNSMICWTEWPLSNGDSSASTLADAGFYVGAIDLIYSLHAYMTKPVVSLCFYDIIYK